MDLENKNLQNQSFDSSYFLKLSAAIIILGAVYFGSSFFKEKPSDQPSAELSGTQQTFAAALPIAKDAFLSPKTDLIFPTRKWTIEEPSLTAKSVFVIDINSNKVLLEKQTEQSQPIASLTKLMTALVIIERANLKDEIVVSKKAVETYGEMGNLKIGETLTIESLLYAMLIESSNDAAVALAESASGGNGQFIGYMNQKAVALGLKNTRFSDPSGLSIENTSTAKDLAKLMQEALKYPLLVQIMKTPETDILSVDGQRNHHLTNSNKLLSKYPEIIAGKTGYIDESGNCMIVAVEAPDGSGPIINVILDTQDRIGEMEKLILWEKKAFIW